MSKPTKARPARSGSQPPTPRPATARPGTAGTAGTPGTTGKAGSAGKAGTAGTPGSEPPPDRPATSAPATTGLPGRRSQAARNDAVILDAAREVFLADPKAPIAAVAERAGVGISALYRRYAGKEELLRQLCHDGLRRFVAEAEAAAGESDGWVALTVFLRRVVDADVHSLTVHLAGTFTPLPAMRREAERANELTTELVRRAHASGRLRASVTVADVGLLLEGCAAIRVPDGIRTKELRQRYLALVLDGLAARDDPPLPGPAPRAGELNWRWRGVAHR